MQANVSQRRNLLNDTVVPPDQPNPGFKRQGTKAVKKVFNPTTTKPKPILSKRDLQIDTFTNSSQEVDEDFYDNQPLNTFGVRQQPLQKKDILV